ncbi:hypothetical protein OG394_31340 [Kribbella sp. NBC_01245]|uniref:hypothetical protein n=1 Tax=Kribbella sp. NBC_01245 TaxID=2903578 RepID=UPI002E2850F0|nr:hypothetical protein [Kribbella sp. NBC_01245]
MNLDDLRQELTTRADEAGHPDLLAGVHHRIRRTKQRRVATALTATAAALALAIAVVPSALTTTKDPDPAVTPRPPDYKLNGLVFPGDLQNGHLQKAWAGKKGESTVEFEWTPTSTKLTALPYCTDSANGTNLVRLTFNDLRVLEQSCADFGPEATTSATIDPSDQIWTSVGYGMQPIRVGLRVVDAQGNEVVDPSIQLGVGFYRTAADLGLLAPSMPSREVPADAGDYVRDGYRYPAKRGTQPLEAAVIGAKGQTSVTLRWTPTSKDVELTEFCVASKPDMKVMATFTVNGHPYHGSSCDDQGPRKLDSGIYHGDSSLRDWLKVGQPNVITLRLEKSGSASPVVDESAQLGFAIYRNGPSRQVLPGHDLRLAETIEHDGHQYRLEGLRTMPAELNTRLYMTGPGDKPFLLLAGGFGDKLAGDSKSRTLLVSGVGDEGAQSQHQGPGLPGILTIPVPPQRARPMAVSLTGAKPTGGFLLMAIYAPVE